MWLDREQTVAQFRLGDNLCYLLRCPLSGETVVIDPSTAAIVDHIDPAAPLRTVVNTHGHHDHCGGNKILCDRSGAVVARFGAEGIPLRDGDRIACGSLELEVLHTPGHTQDSICLRQGTYLFTGDTLFIASCGNAYGRNAMQALFTSLTKLSLLPPETVCCVGHDYARSALAFALTIEPDNRAAVAKRDQLAGPGAPVISTLAEEQSYNPFFRLAQPAVGRFLQERMGCASDDPEARFLALRELRNA